MKLVEDTIKFALGKAWPLVVGGDAPLTLGIVGCHRHRSAFRGSDKRVGEQVEPRHFIKLNDNRVDAGRR